MVVLVSNSADADACLFQESKEIRMNDVKSAISLALLDNARDVDFASTCRLC
jgi:hypothetical protein